MVVSNLDTRIIPLLEYTRRDEIIFSLLDIIKCPIIIGTSEDMVIFNHQFYDREAFQRHRTTEQVSQDNLIARGRLDREDARLKDPRTGDNFNRAFALRSLYHSRPSRAMIANLIVQRIIGITVSEIDQFLPALDDYNTNSENFVSQIKGMVASRSQQHDLYCRHIEALQNAAASMTTSPSTRNPPPPPSTHTSTSTSTSTMYCQPILASPLAALLVDTNALQNEANDARSDSSEGSLFATTNNANTEASDSDGDSLHINSPNGRIRFGSILDGGNYDPLSTTTTVNPPSS